MSFTHLAKDLLIMLVQWKQETFLVSEAQWGFLARTINVGSQRKRTLSSESRTILAHCKCCLTYLYSLEVILTYYQSHGVGLKILYFPDSWSEVPVASAALVLWGSVLTLCL